MLADFASGGRSAPCPDPAPRLVTGARAPGPIAGRERFTPEQVVALKPSDKVMATLRQKVERELYGAYLRGSQTALDEIDTLRAAPVPPPPSSSSEAQPSDAPLASRHAARDGLQFLPGGSPD